MGGKEREFKYTLRQKNLSDTLNHQKYWEIQKPQNKVL